MLTQVTGELFLTSNVPVYGADIARRGSAVIFAVRATQLGGSFPVLSVVIEHKNRDETTWTTAATFSPLTVPGQTRTKGLTSPKQQLRLKLTLAAGTAARVFIYKPRWQP